MLVGDDEASDYLKAVIRALDEHPGVKRVAVIGAGSALLTAAGLAGSTVAFDGAAQFVATASGTTSLRGSMASAVAGAAASVKVAAAAVAVVGLAVLGGVALGLIDVGGDEARPATTDVPVVTEVDPAGSGDDGGANGDTAGSTADDSAPAIDSFEISPTPASAETPVQVSVFSSDRESGVAEIAILVDGSITQTCPADSCAATIGPLPAGEYDVEVIVRDRAGNVAEDRLSLVVQRRESSVTVAPDEPPVATISSPRLAADLDRQSDGTFDVFLDASRSFDPNAGDLSYSWTVEMNGDGSVLPLDSVEQGISNFDRDPPCDQTSTYRFTLTVVDGTGMTSVASADVEYVNIC